MTGYIKKVGVVILLISSVIIGLVLMSELAAGLGILRPLYKMSTAENDSVLIYLDRSALYKIQPACRSDINKSGFRGSDFSSSGDHDRRIFFMGDSFVFGSGVESNETIPATLENKLGKSVQVYNLGVPGYGPDQALALLKENGPRYRPDTVILSLFPANDFKDIIQNRLYETDADERLVPHKPNAVESVMPWLSLLYSIQHIYLKYSKGLQKEQRFGMANYYEKLFQDLFADGYDWDLILRFESIESRRKIVLMRAILRDFRETCARLNARFIVVLIPSVENMSVTDYFAKMGIPKEKYFVIENAALSLCRELSIPALNLYPLFLKQRNIGDLYIPGDGHLSPHGCNFIADRLKEML
jgi:hypothetical protein